MCGDFNFKLAGLTAIIFIGALTVFCCLMNPAMHKPFQLNIIEYMLKINTDGSVTSTKSVTTTILKEVNE